jgi:hypothetical protein
MAKFTPGIAVAAVSGSTGGTVFSHNRYGAYMRTRAIPVKSTSDAALNAKQQLAQASQAWQTLTAAQRLSWNGWALTNPIVNTLGFKQVLTGHAAYVGLNSRLAHDGIAAITDPPVVPAPTGLITAVQDGDIGIGNFDLEFTASPLAANEKLWMKAALVDSAGINYVQNILRFIGTSAAAETTPFDNQALVEARLGTLIVGQYVHMSVQVFDDETGLLSAPRQSTVIVTETS